MRPGWVVELTEHCVRNELSHKLTEFCQALTATGLTLALDDCTQGHLYGSRKFWRDSGASIIKASVRDPSVESIALDAKDEGLSLFIEGVENAADFERAIALRADGVQGWYVGHPVAVFAQERVGYAEFA